MNNSAYSKSFVIIAPACREWDLAFYLREEFRVRGIECHVFPYHQVDPKEANRELFNIVKEHTPDVVLGLKLDTIEPATLRKIKKAGAMVVLWYVDCFTPDVPDWLIPLLHEVDLFFTTAKGMIPKYKSLCTKPIYWVYEGAHLPAYPKIEMTENQSRTYKSQVAFIGNVFQPPSKDPTLALRRLHLFNRISERFAMRVWGPQAKPVRNFENIAYHFRMTRWPAYNEEFVKVCQGTDILLGINTVNSVELYFSARTFMALAAGGFHLTHYVPGLETMFENHRHLVWFQSDEECLELIDHYLTRPGERRRIAQEGQQLVRTRYSMAGQLDKVLTLIDAHS